MIRETRDPAVLNAFAAHPDIAPHVGGPLDFTAAIRPSTHYHFGEHGGFCYELTAPGTYEVHVMIEPVGRGKWAWAALEESVSLMSARGAETLWARIRADDRHIAAFAQRGGFRDTGRRLDDWRIFERRLQCRH
jgi:hypothetical protein